MVHHNGAANGCIPVSEGLFFHKKLWECVHVSERETEHDKIPGKVQERKGRTDQ